MKNPWTGHDPDRGLLAVDQTLEALLERITEGQLSTLGNIQAQWPEVVTAPWGERCRPVRLDRGVLTIEVADGAAATRLRFERGEIAGRLNQQIGRGEIAQIRVRVSRDAKRRSGHRNGPKPPG